MNPLCTIAALALHIACSVAAEPPKITYVRGPCQGGLRPSLACKTCERCAYCGKKPGGVVKGARPENSGTCIVCEKRAAGRK